MSVELKIKSKHLSEEARIIRFEERKVKNQMNWHKDRQQPFEKEASLYRSLSTHRRWEVRNENRATFLARAYLAGKEYKTIENKCHDPMVLRAYILPRVYEMVNKYGPRADKLSKKWNRERNRYEYDAEPWKAHCDKVKAWTEI
jgi:hypothetical protein